MKVTIEEGKEAQGHKEELSCKMRLEYLCRKCGCVTFRNWMGFEHYEDGGVPKFVRCKHEHCTAGLAELSGFNLEGRIIILEEQDVVTKEWTNNEVANAVLDKEHAFKNDYIT